MAVIPGATNKALELSKFSEEATYEYSISVYTIHAYIVYTMQEYVL